MSHDLVRFLKAIDPNDTDSPRTSFVLGGKLFSNTQTTTAVNPDAEDLSLILTHMTPRNSFQKNFKRSDSSKPLVMHQQSENEVLKRDKTGNSSKNSKNKTFEDMFIDPILFKHLKNLLEQMDFQNLGYMSAALDIQLVTWLSKEKEKLPKIDDFVAALKKLHTSLDWPKPSLNLKIGADGIDANDEPSPGSPNGSKTLLSSNQSSVLESRDSGYSGTFMQQMEQVQRSGCVREKGEDDVDSVLSELTSVLENDLVLTQEPPVSITQMPSQRSKKLEVQMRYMLQIFTEANCLDLSLLLSILLLDSTSVARVCNAAIRSSSLSICRQLKNGLKDLTRWSFNECLGYRSFMLGCSEEIAALDRFVTQQESIPDLPNIYIGPEKSPLVRSTSVDGSSTSGSLIGKSTTSNSEIIYPRRSIDVQSDDIRLGHRSADSTPPIITGTKPSLNQETSSSCAIM